jgi:hypothetical protein
VTSWDDFPRLWRRLLDEVWQTVRANTLIVPGRNVMLYKANVPRRLGPRWEIYGHWKETSPEQEVEIYYLVD